MLFKKKEKETQEEEPILTDNQAQKLLDRFEVIKGWIRQNTSDYNFGRLDQEEYDRRMKAFSEEADALEQIISGQINEENQKVFDAMFGNPIPWLDEIFNTDAIYNKKIQEKTGEIDGERTKETGTD